MPFVRLRRSVLEFSERQKKKLKKTLDTAGVVRDTALIRTLTRSPCYSRCEWKAVCGAMMFLWTERRIWK